MQPPDIETMRRPAARALGRALCGGLLWGLSLAAAAHEPVARCVMLDAQTVRCRGGYGHGEEAPGASMLVIDHAGQTLVAGKLDNASTLTFTRPAAGFYVLFDVGPGHQVVVEDDEIGPPPAGVARAKWMHR